MPVGNSKGAMQDAVIGEVVAGGEDVQLQLSAGDAVIFTKCAPRGSVDNFLTLTQEQWLCMNRQHEEAVLSILQVTDCHARLQHIANSSRTADSCGDVVL